MEYQLAVKTAEEAVASMKDPKLREIAFGQILARLLSAEKHLPSRSAEAAQKSPATQAVSSKGKKPTGVKAWLLELVSEGFFKNPRSLKAILGQLSAQSHHLSGPDLTRQLQNLCHDKVLRRKKLPSGQGKATVWHWSKW